jgi:hypothetical protein
MIYLNKLYSLLIPVMSLLLLIACAPLGVEEIEEDELAQTFPPCQTTDEDIFGTFSLELGDDQEKVSMIFSENGTLILEHHDLSDDSLICRETSDFAFCNGGIYGKIVSNSCNFTGFSSGDQWFDKAELTNEGNTLSFPDSGNRYERE